MIHTCRRSLVLALVALRVAAVVALAAEATRAGTVQALDPATGHLTLRAEAGQVVELQVPAEVLTGLGPGDAVVVKVSVQKARPPGQKPLSPHPQR